MTEYAAFLRGINVGGNKKINMGDLKNALEPLGFTNVRTLLASGNVLFETRRADARALTRAIEGRIKKALGMEVSVILRTREQVRRLVASDPFKSVKVTPLTRLFVTLLGEKPRSELKIPYLSPDKSFRIFRVSDGEVCSVLTLTPRWGANLRQMDILEKEFGKKITTRTWNTIRKMV
jgi:uncharacterized protein (DUF1697 family)